MNVSIPTKNAPDVKFSARRPLTVEEEAEIQRMIASDPDAPELTAEELAGARSFGAFFPEMAESVKTAKGRPRSPAPKKLTTLRIDPDVIEAFRATGPGWQSRINEALRRALADL